MIGPAGFMAAPKAAPKTTYASLAEAIDDFVSIGCTHAPNALGFAKMPEGFALMIDSDGMYYFYVSVDGESCNHWDKWAVYRWAKSRAAANIGAREGE